SPLLWLHRSLSVPVPFLLLWLRRLPPPWGSLPLGPRPLPPPWGSLPLCPRPLPSFSCSVTLSRPLSVSPSPVLWLRPPRSVPILFAPSLDCVDKGKCQTNGTSSFAGVTYSTYYECCEGEFCNSAAGAGAQLSLAAGLAMLGAWLSRGL
uniref:UPAR/Ly6 domain-containing protein n=1 Tax=Gopherus evgoodei TaxID=1825980 RepID=A0A8C4WR51_9SAUR